MNMMDEVVVGCAPERLRINDRKAPIDIEPGSVPVLSWVNPLAEATKTGIVAGQAQPEVDTATLNTVAAYQVIVSSTSEQAESGEGDIWDSGRVDGNGVQGVPLRDVPSDPSSRYWIAVRTWRGESQDPTAYSEPMTFGTGPGEYWQAEPIWGDPNTASPYTKVELPQVAREAEEQRQNTDQFANKPPVLTSEHISRGWAFFRGRITLPNKPIRWATLSATGASVWRSRQFVYRLWLNGHFVGLGPTFPIAKEARYDGYDVTAQLVPGRDNFIGVIAYALEDQRFIAQLDVTYADGTTDHFGTGSSWLSKVANDVFPDGDTVGSHVYELPAENIRTELYPRGMSERGFNDADWELSVVRPAFERLQAAPIDKPRVEEWDPASKHVTEDGRLIVDFGRTVAGGIRLSAKVGKLTDLVIRYGEVLNEDGTVKYQLSAYNTYQETWHFVPTKTGTPITARSWGMKVFRYVEILPAKPDANLIRELGERDSAIQAQAIVYPFDDHAAAFDSSDKTLNQVWQLCRNTIESLNVNIYADSWTRERIPYEADAWLQQRAHLALDHAPELGEYSIDFLLANRTWPTEWPLYLVLAVHDEWWSTGNLRQASTHWDQILSMLPDRYVDADSGLLVKAPGESSHTDGDLVDWPPAERDEFQFGHVNTVINALASQAYADAGELAEALGRDDEAQRLTGIATRMRAAIHERLYDEQTGAYVDGLDTGADGDQLGHCSEHASAFALAFAQVPADRREPVARFLRNKGMACSVYVAAILLGGLYRAGYGADATALIAATEGERTWHHMIEQGAGSTMEAWSQRLKTNTTYSHPWASSPVYLLP